MIDEIAILALKKSGAVDVSAAVAAKVAAQAAQYAAETAQAAAEDAAEDAAEALASEYSTSSTYAVGDYCVKDGVLYRCTTAISTAESWTAAHWAATKVTTELASDYSSLKSQITQKANIDGYYESMTVGNAEQIVATVGVEDSAPYNFRTAGGSADIGDRLVDKLVGGTIAWNQLVKKGNFSDNLGWNSSNATSSANSNILTTILSAQNSATQISRMDFYPIDNHKYLAICDIKPQKNTHVRFQYSSIADGTRIDAITANVWTTVSNVFKSIGSNGILLYYNTSTELTTGDETQFRNFMCFDLTQMFGSTIADYIYSLEQATAGAGVAWFRHLFPKDYYAYNPGELMSVQAASHITRGFNAWDEEWENGDINANTGNNGTNTTNWRSKNYIPIIPSTTYYAYSPTAANKTLRARFYDANKNYLGYSPKSGSTYTDNAFVTPDNAYFMRFAPNISEVPNHDICINLSWDGERDGEYEEYTEHVYPLDDSLTLRGIPKLDASNNLYYDGDTYESDGTVTRRYKQNQMTYEWLSARDENGIGYDSNRGAVWVRNWNYADMEMRSGGINALCNAFDVSVMDSSIQSTQYRIYFFGQTDVSSFLTKVQALETAGSGLYLVYKLAEPTTESADPYQNPQIVDDFGTEEYVDAGVTAATPTRDVAIPVGHETTYQANLRAKLEMAPDSPSDGDGDYIVRQTNGTNEYAKLVIPTELPTVPTTDGTYHLKATVSDGTTTLTWEADT